MTFEWDEVKERANQGKHGLDFQEAQRAFLDPLRLTIMDNFTLHSGKIRILGAAWWRKGRKLYGR